MVTLKIKYFTRIPLEIHRLRTHFHFFFSALKGVLTLDAKSIVCDQPNEYSTGNYFTL